jgi:hypothetical protein
LLANAATFAATFAETFSKRTSGKRRRRRTGREVFWWTGRFETLCNHR